MTEQEFLMKEHLISGDDVADALATTVSKAAKGDKRIGQTLSLFGALFLSELHEIVDEKEKANEKR